MAKSIRSKVKKRLRTVKRGVVKRELTKTGTSHNDGELAKQGKIAEALSGHLKPHKRIRNAFRSDDPDADIPQHNWRQGPDFRSGFVEDTRLAGLAVVGAQRPKSGTMGYRETAPASLSQPQNGSDPKLDMLMRGADLVPFMASKETKRRVKSVKNKSGVDVNAAFRWT